MHRLRTPGGSDPNGEGPAPRELFPGRLEITPVDPTLRLWAFQLEPDSVDRRDDVDSDRLNADLESDPRNREIALTDFACWRAKGLQSGDDPSRIFGVRTDGPAAPAAICGMPALRLASCDDRRQMSKGWPLLLVAALLIPALAHTVSAEVRVVAPADGGVLRGGETARLEWEAESLPAGSEEWEAFLSVDGGRYYAVRITPHLDVQIRRATWTVPNISARDVRLLLRFGNEKNERLVQVRSSVSIEARSSTTAIVPVALTAGLPGEPARPGDRGVASWVDGDREGRHAYLVRARGPETVGAAATQSRTSEQGAMAFSQGLRLAAPPARFCPCSDHTIRPPPGAAQWQRSSDDVLLRSHRLNI
jgi:hypothetical protein